METCGGSFKRDGDPNLEKNAQDSPPWAVIPMTNIVIDDDGSDDDDDDDSEVYSLLTISIRPTTT